MTMPPARKLNWKVAAIAGTATTVGLGGFVSAGAMSDDTPTDDQTETNDVQSAPPATLSAPVLVTPPPTKVEQEIVSVQTPITEADDIEADGVEADEVEAVEVMVEVVEVDTPSVDSPVDVADTPSVDSPVSVADTPSVDSPVSVADTPSVDSPVSVD